jgi:hypothetical protein
MKPPAGHGRVGLATAARDAIDVIIPLSTALAVRMSRAIKMLDMESASSTS